METDFTKIMQDICENKLAELGERLKADYVAILERNGKRASGGLVDSVEAQVSVNGSVFQLTIYAAEYWKWIEAGRKPGTMPPISAIEQWINVKPIVPDNRTGRVPTPKQLAFMISRSIGEKGIKPLPAFEQTIQKNNKTINKMTASISELAGEQIGSEMFFLLKDDIKKYWLNKK